MSDTPVTNELMFEVMKRMQADISIIKQTLTDHTRILIRMREDDLRLETMQAEAHLRLDRIERRLDLTEA